MGLKAAGQSPYPEHTTAGDVLYPTRGGSQHHQQQGTTATSSPAVVPVLPMGPLQRSGRAVGRLIKTTLSLVVGLLMQMAHCSGGHSWSRRRNRTTAEARQQTDVPCDTATAASSTTPSTSSSAAVVASDREGTTSSAPAGSVASATPADITSTTSTTEVPARGGDPCDTAAAASSSSAPPVLTSPVPASSKDDSTLSTLHAPAADKSMSAVTPVITSTTDGTAAGGGITSSAAAHRPPSDAPAVAALDNNSGSALGLPGDNAASGAASPTTSVVIMQCAADDVPCDTAGAASSLSSFTAPARFTPAAGVPSSSDCTNLAAPTTDNAASATAEETDTSVGFASDLVASPAVDDCVTSQAITLRCLRKLAAHLQYNVFGDEFPRLATGDLKRWVLETTEQRQCRLVEVPELVGPGDVGPPHYFVSHAWGNSFEGLLRGIEGFLANAAEDTRVWLDVFAVNQHDGTERNKRDVESFEDVIKQCAYGTLVVMGPSGSFYDPSSRAWCVYEWAVTLAQHGPDGLLIPLGPTEREALVSKIDISKASCYFEKDKEMIMRKVETEHGSVDSFNSRLKLMLMLQPLFYKADMRRLLDRCKGAQWDWGPVEQWLEAGEAGPRVLCVLAGAGEGKSTISAALCSNEALIGGARKTIMLHHFIKYSDQRRLDPLNVVRSLAFQLASKVPALNKFMFTANRTELLTGAADIAVEFQELLTNPIEKLAWIIGRPRQVVIVLDALDEADPSPTSSSGGSVVPLGNKVFTLLVKHLHALPRYIRFVLTTRPGGLEGKVCESLEHAFTSSDLQFIVPRQLGLHSPSAPTLDVDGAAVSSESAGVLVYNAVVAQCDLPARSLHDGVPQLADLYWAYDQLLKEGMAAHDPKAQQRMKELLAVLLAAQEPLPESLIQSMGLHDTLRQLPGYPVTFFEDEHRVHILHKSLTDWLITGSGAASGEPSGSSEPFLSPADLLHGHRLIIHHLRAMVESTSNAGEGLPVYTLKYLVWHLVECGDAAGLEAVLQRLDFIAAVFSQGHGHMLVRDIQHLREGVSPLLADLQRGFMVQQHSLASPSVKSATDVALCLLSCPTRTGIFRVARRYLLLAAPPPATGGRLRDVLGGTTDWTPLRMTLKGHGGEVTSVSWSPDGSTLTSGSSASKDQLIRLWNVASGQCLGTLTERLNNMGWNTIVSWSPDGKRVAHGRSDHRVLLWDVATGQCTCTLQSGPSVCLSWSPDSSNRIACAGGGDHLLRVWDVDSVQCTATLKGHKGWVTCLSWGLDGQTLASGGMDKTVRVWDLANGQQCTHTLKGHDSDILAVSLGPDGKTLASGGRDRDLRLWDVATGQCTHKLAGHTLSILSLSWSPDGKTLASGSLDKTVRLWDVASWKCSDVFKEFGGSVASVSWSPDGKILASGGNDKIVRLYDVASRSGLPSNTQAVEGVGVQSVCWSPDGTMLASGSNDKAIRLWDVASGECIKTLQGHAGALTAVSWSPDGKTLASGSKDKTIQLWDVASGQCACTLEGHQKPVTSVAWSPEGSRLASGATDDFLRLWNAASGQCTNIFEGHDHALSNVCWSPDGGTLAHGTRDMSLRLWDVASGKCIGMMAGTCWVCGVSWSPDGKTIAIGRSGGDTKLQLWDVASCQSICTLEGHAYAVDSVSWSPNGKTLATGANDQVVRLWDTASGRCTATLKGHADFVYSVSWSPDSSTVASGSRDGTVRLWDVTHDDGNNDTLQGSPPPRPSALSTTARMGPNAALDGGEDEARCTVVRFTANNPDGDESVQAAVAAVQADFPAPPSSGIYYFEVTIEGTPGTRGAIAVGYAPGDHDSQCHVGCEAGSVGLHSGDGNVYYQPRKGAAGSIKCYGFTYGKGDVVGAALDFQRNKVFFTKNGTKGGRTLSINTSSSSPPLYPTVSLGSEGEVVSFNFGQRPFAFDVEPYKIRPGSRVAIKHTALAAAQDEQQRGFASWNPVMERMLLGSSRTGVVEEDNVRGNVRVKMEVVDDDGGGSGSDSGVSSSTTTTLWAPSLLVPVVDSSGAGPPAEVAVVPFSIDTGAKVAVRCLALDEARAAQAGHGGWCEAMEAMLLGDTTGVVEEVDEDGDVRVRVDEGDCTAPGSGSGGGGISTLWNPLLLLPVPQGPALPSALSTVRIGASAALGEGDGSRCTTARFIADDPKGEEAATVQSDFPAPPSSGIYYFEVKIVNTGTMTAITVGYAPSNADTKRHVGKLMESFGLSGRYGKSCFAKVDRSYDAGFSFCEGDVVGAALDFQRNEIFFTKNGKKGSALSVAIRRLLYPTVSLGSKGEAVAFNFGQRPFVFDIEAAKAAASVDPPPPAAAPS